MLPLSPPQLLKGTVAFCFSSGGGVRLWDSFGKFNYMLGPKERKIEPFKQ